MDGRDPDGSGGDPPCWADAFPVPPTGVDAAVADLPALAASALAGVAWSVETADLDVNLVVFPAGGGVEAHVNDEVDVLLIGIRGGGTLEIDGLPHTLLPGRAAVAPRGARRAIRAGRDGIACLTGHRRRARLLPAPAHPER